MRKSDILKTSIFKSLKSLPPDQSLGSFKLQIKNRGLGAKLHGYSIIFTLKGITTFQSQRVHAFY